MCQETITYKAVIAWILKSCTKEFSQYSVNFICDNCLKENIEISSRAVHQDHPDRSKLLDGNEQIDCLNSEANAIKDQTVYYDIRFKGRYSRHRRTRLQLIINLEIQLNDTPGYPLVTRGFYYCGKNDFRAVWNYFTVNIMKSFRKSTVFGSPGSGEKNVEMESSDTIQYRIQYWESLMKLLAVMTLWKLLS